MAASTRSVSTYDAKTHLSQLLAEVENGQAEVIITRHDRPVARLVPFLDPHATRTPGAFKGQVVVPDGWDEFTAQDDIDWYGHVPDPGDDRDVTR